MALLVGVIVRRLCTKLLLLYSSQLHNPVRKGVETFLHQNSVQSVPAQLGAHPHWPLAPRGMIGDEILREAPIIEQFFAAQGLEQGRNDPCIVTFLKQFTA